MADDAELGALERELAAAGGSIGTVECPACGEAVELLWSVEGDDSRVLLCWSGHRFTAEGKLVE